jgi:putative membrane protein
MNQLTTIFKEQRDWILIAIAIIFYSVGTFGILDENNRNWFLGLSPFNLILSFCILVAASHPQRHRLFLVLVLSFIVGLIAEWIGVHTGLLFGNYYYGNNLGFKYFDVPLVIGLNWGLLVVCAGSIANRFKLETISTVILGAALMTGLDYLMEPVAIKSDFWHWKNGEIPIYNFVCWFLVALPLQWANLKWNKATSNKVYDALFIILVLFFTILNLN